MEYVFVIKIQKGRVNSLDRVELKIKLDQMNELREEGEFERAAEVADTIEWRKIKRLSELSFAADIYESAERFRDARNVCVHAYNRKLGGKRLIYRLAELSLKMDDLSEAEDLYEEFIEIAPKDTNRFILLYKISIARGESTDELIKVLEEYKQNELEEQFEYELALLYAKANRIEDCIRECDDLILWFNDGEYVEKALILKSKFVPLTRSQQEKFDEMQREKARIAAMEAEPKPENAIPKYAYKSELEPVTKASKEVDINDIKIPISNISLYDTQTLQAELAKNMSVILEDMSKDKKNSENVLKATNFSDANEPVIETLDDALPKTGQSLSSKKVTDSTKEIRINARHWSKNTPVSDEEENNVEEENLGSSDDVIEGQIGLLDWLNSMSDNNEENSYSTMTDVKDKTLEMPLAVENNMAATMEPELQPEPAPEVKPQADISEEDRMVEELTQKLIEEVQADLMERTVTVVPDELPEEEYVSSESDELPEEEYNSQTYEEMKEAYDSQTYEEPTEAHNSQTYEEPTEAHNSQTYEEPTEAHNSQTYEESAEVNNSQVYEETTVKSTFDKKSALVSENATDSVAIEKNDRAECENKLTDAEKKYVRKYLGIEGVEAAIANTIRGKKKEVSDGTSSYGNIVITGKADTDRSGFAINLFKALHAGESTKQLRIAKTTSASLNKNGILSSAAKIKGTTLIIENASTLMPEVVKELTAFMLGQTESMLLIITGEEYSINKMFRDFPTFAALFGYKLELKNMSVNDLVNMAKEYSKERGYVIDEKALLKVYLLVDGFHMKFPGAEIEETKKLVDEAIERCDNGSKWPFRHKSKGLIILKEKHFS